MFRLLIFCISLFFFPQVGICSHSEHLNLLQTQNSALYPYGSKPIPEKVAIYGGETGHETFERTRSEVTRDLVPYLKRVSQEIRQSDPSDSLVESKFRELLTRVAEKRNQVAIQTRSENPGLFGLWRKRDSVTPIYPEEYQTIARGLKRLLTLELSVLFGSKKFEDSPKDIFRWDAFTGFEESERPAKILVGSTDRIFERNPDSTSEDYILAKSDLPPPYDKFYSDVASLINFNLNEINTKFSLAGKILVQRYLDQLTGKVPGRLVSALYFITDPATGEDIVTTSFYTIHIDDPKSPTGLSPFSISRYEFEDTYTLIHHMNPDHQPKIIPNLAKKWREILLWRGSNADELKEKCAEFHYLMSHAMIFVRGSAAITEWITLALYLYHDFKPTRYSDNSIDELAMGNPSMKKFVSEYVSDVVLTPIKSRNCCGTCNIQ